MSGNWNVIYHGIKSTQFGTVKVTFRAKLDNKYLWPLIEISQADASI